MAAWSTSRSSNCAAVICVSLVSTTAGADSPSPSASARDDLSPLRLARCSGKSRSCWAAAAMPARPRSGCWTRCSSEASGPTWSSERRSARCTGRWSRPTRAAASVAKLQQAWQELSGLGVLGRSWFDDAVSLLRTRTHVRSNAPMRRLAERLIGVGTFEELAVPFQCVAACIERFSEHWFDTGPLVDAILASSAVPGILPPVEIGGEHFIDGGIVNSIPVDRAVALGAGEIYVLHAGRIEQPLSPPRLDARRRLRRLRDRAPAPLRARPRRGARRRHRPRAADRRSGARPATTTSRSSASATSAASTSRIAFAYAATSEYLDARA